MATLLLILIFFAFVGLGIPDSLFGAAWPAIYPEFGVPVASASVVTLTISACTVISSVFSARLINRLGTGLVSLISTALTAIALLGFSLSHGFLWLCLLALPLGFGAGAIDSGLNNYVALHYRASHMSFLHCCYGVGVSLSPYLMSIALADNNDWRGGYRLAFFIQLAITALLLLALPLWGRVRQTAADTAPVTPRALSLREQARCPAIRAVWGLFASSVAIEVACGSWGSTFLVSARGLSAEHAARVITFYYLGMTLGRFLSGVLATRVSSWRLIRGGQTIVLAAIVLLAIPLPLTAGIGLFLVGLGNGPTFPNLNYLTPHSFGADVSQSVMGTQLAASYTGTMVAPPLFGLLAQSVGAWVFPWFLLALFALLTACLLRETRLLKAAGRY